MYLESIVKEHITTAFRTHKVNNPELENAIAEAFTHILLDRTVMESLAKSITEIQNFNEQRMKRF